MGAALHDQQYSSSLYVRQVDTREIILPGLKTEERRCRRDRIMAQNQAADFFTAISLAAVKDPNMLLLLCIGGGLLFTIVSGICAAWLRSAAGKHGREPRVGFSLQKGGLVATHYERGNAFIRSGDINRAIESYSKALRLNPNYADALIGRGMALCKKGDYENAMADFSEALYLDPKSAKAYYYRGSILCTKGDYAGAIADYDCSLHLHPSQKKVRNARELAIAKMNKTEG
jgi:tetratricopeptide (TPR) repeat protein